MVECKCKAPTLVCRAEINDRARVTFLATANSAIVRPPTQSPSPMSLDALVGSAGVAALGTAGAAAPRARLRRYDVTGHRVTGCGEASSAEPSCFAVQSLSVKVQRRDRRSFLSPADAAFKNLEEARDDVLLVVAAKHGRREAQSSPLSNVPICTEATGYRRLTASRRPSLGSCVAKRYAGRKFPHRAAPDRGDFA